MRFLAISKRLPGADVQKIMALGLDETRAAWSLYANGPVRELCFDKDKSKGLIFLECASEQQVRETLATLPLVQAGQIDFDVYALGPYANLSVLFAK
jgi:hypothetical protein